jgi:23S rRNA (uracil1939-C5)-methyltransferase
MLERLIPRLAEAADTADPSHPAADLYCGVGTFAAFLRNEGLAGQSRFPRIDLVEESRTALELARLNVPGAGRRFFPLTGERWIQSRESAEPYGFMVTDPPRQGLSPPVRSWLALQGPPVLAYVSCDPATLARDAAALRNGGYQLDSLTFFDFYPQTAHIESLAVFRRDTP